jgi:hypothetical protein
MNLLARIKTGLIIVSSALCLFGCNDDDEGLLFNVETDTRVIFEELDLATTNIFIDSLRSDNEPNLLTGSVTSDLGNVTATGLIRYAYRSGDIITPGMEFDSLMMFILLDDLRTEVTDTRDRFLIGRANKELFEEAVYLSDYDAEVDSIPIDTVNILVNRTNSFSKDSLDGFGRYLFSRLQEADSVTEDFQDVMAIYPSDETQSMLSISLDPDSTYLVLYAHQDSVLYETQFGFTNVYYTNLKRERVNSINDLDTSQVFNDFSILSPLFGAYTLVDLTPLKDFIAGNEQSIVNKAEFVISVAGTDQAVDEIKYYFYKPESGFRGEGLLSDPFNTAILTNQGYLPISNNPLISRLENDGYVGDATIFIESYMNRFFLDGTYLTDRLVLTGNRFLILDESRILDDQVKLRLYYTQIN